MNADLAGRGLAGPWRRMDFTGTSSGHATAVYQQGASFWVGGDFPASWGDQGERHEENNAEASQETHNVAEHKACSSFLL